MNLARGRLHTKYGSTAASPVVLDNNGVVLVGPTQQGILVRQQGEIGIFADGSILLAQSRIFTEWGGDISIWSSNGDINAGKGAKTSAVGGVAGAGIATLQTLPEDPLGNVVLVAPRGTVDAGDAGIRVSGDIFVAAQSVANADNIRVGGASVGVPVPAAVDSVALASASNTKAVAVDDEANRLGRRECASQCERRLCWQETAVHNAPAYVCSRPREGVNPPIVIVLLSLRRTF